MGRIVAIAIRRFVTSPAVSLDAAAERRSSLHTRVPYLPSSNPASYVASRCKSPLFRQIKRSSSSFKPTAHPCPPTDNSPDEEEELQAGRQA